MQRIPLPSPRKAGAAAEVPEEAPAGMHGPLSDSESYSATSQQQENTERASTLAELDAIRAKGAAGKLLHILAPELLKRQGLSCTAQVQLLCGILDMEAIAYQSVFM